MMTSCTLKKATPKNLDAIVTLLTDMSAELQELDHFDPNVARQAIGAALGEGVHWFLFLDDAGQVFGTCYLQSLHNYWRVKKRYYLGGFYIAPNYRGRGLFREINALLVDWAKENDGVQIYCHINEDNIKSMESFKAVGMEATEFRLFANHWGDQAT